MTEVEYCTGWAEGRRLSSESCMVNVTSTEAGATVTRTADAVVVAVPLGVPWKQLLGGSLVARKLAENAQHCWFFEGFPCFLRVSLRKEL